MSQRVRTAAVVLTIALAGFAAGQLYSSMPSTPSELARFISTRCTVDIPFTIANSSANVIGKSVFINTTVPSRSARLNCY